MARSLSSGSASVDATVGGAVVGAAVTATILGALSIASDAKARWRAHRSSDPSTDIATPPPDGSPALRESPPGRWWRTNYAGSPVSLFGGPAVMLGAIAGSIATGRLRHAAVAAVVGGVGLYDDLYGTTKRRGLRGHLAAARSGEVTSGAVKVGVLGLAGVLAAAAEPDAQLHTPCGLLDVAVDAAVVAGTANLLNLLDLRPGRAVKAATAIGVPIVLASGPAGAVLGAVAALAPHDLAADTMMGDCGANASGAMLGLALVDVAPRPVRVGWLVVVTSLTLVSERISFSAVIDRVSWLRRLDLAGRRPPPA